VDHCRAGVAERVLSLETAVSLGRAKVPLVEPPWKPRKHKAYLERRRSRRVSTRCRQICVLGREICLECCRFDKRADRSNSPQTYQRRVCRTRAVDMTRVAVAQRPFHVIGVPALLYVEAEESRSRQTSGEQPKTVIRGAF
jgi:hypothetical protein